MRLRLSIFFLLTSCNSIRLAAYVVAYDRLYSKDTNVVIDILHDDHATQRRLSRRDMLKKSFSYVKKRLYKTEKRILQALDRIQQVAPGKVDLIWELGLYSEPGDSAFLAHGHKLVKKQFPRLNFIVGDIARDALEDILLSRSGALTYTIDGTSINNPVPLPKARMHSIKKRYGAKGWQSFKSFFTTTAKRVTKHFTRGFLAGKRYKHSYFEKLDSFDALCDIELVSHILSSEKKHIIVYCGGWHADNLTDFLMDKMGYDLTHEVYNRGREVPVRKLAPLDRSYGTAASS